MAARAGLIWLNPHMYPELVTLSSLQCQWKESYFYGGAPLILIQTSKTGQKNCFVKTTIIFCYAEREPRETYMGPHGCMGREFRETVRGCEALLQSNDLPLCGLDSEVTTCFNIDSGEGLKQGRHSPATWKGWESGLPALLTPQDFGLSCPAEGQFVWV